MKKNAAFRDSFNPRLHLTPIALLAATALFLAGLGGAAFAAPPVGKDGKIHACYLVKGKPKGSLRVVPGQKRCKRGERKVIWSVAGSSGLAGSNGQNGTSGPQGESGSTGSSGSSEVALKSEVASLAVQLKDVQNLLQGVDKGDLAGMLGRVNSLEGVVEGVTNEQLQETVDSLPLLNEVCLQSSALTDALNPVLGFLTILGLDPVDPIVCPAP